MLKFVCSLLIIFVQIGTRSNTNATVYAKQLYDDLVSSYNSPIRPVANDSDPVAVRLSLKLSQLIDLNMKNQILTINVWVEQMWIDYKLTWDPEQYGGTREMYIPSDKIWGPDVVLLNNADGNYERNAMAKATIHFTGLIVWTLPAIYKSFCEIDVEWFPFDEQTCFLKFGSWTYNGKEVDLQHMLQEPGKDVVPVGIDLTEYHPSVEWDLLGVPARLNEEFYSCCDEPYIDLTFNITIRRKMMFYTVNLVIPCVIICFLTVLVFYLPSDSGEKIALSINILVSLSWFFLLLAEITPPTSMAVPLIGKYLLLTFLLVVTSVCLTVGVLRVHFKGYSAQKMPPWVHTVFLHVLPKILRIERPPFDPRFSQLTHNKENIPVLRNFEVGLRRAYSESISGNTYSPVNIRRPLSHLDCSRQRKLLANLNKRSSPNVLSALESAEYLANHILTQADTTKEIEDWKYVALVLDRLFLWIFILTCCSGTVWILLLAPSLTDMRVPIDHRVIRKNSKWL